MRKVIEEQLQLGEVDIARITFDLRSRDEIPQLLMGLQYIYVTPELRHEVFSLLEEHIELKKQGRRGMDLWKILVIGTLRLNCNWDYDKVKEMVDNHLTLREMLGHSVMDKKSHYSLQTLKDNLELLTPELLTKINEPAVKYGQSLVKKKMMKFMHDATAS